MNQERTLPTETPEQTIARLYAAIASAHSEYRAGHHHECGYILAVALAEGGQS